MHSTNVRGAKAARLEPGVRALRPLRWPAERLDTLGGYLTFHNVTLFALFLSLYSVAAIIVARVWRAGGGDRRPLGEGGLTGCGPRDRW